MSYLNVQMSQGPEKYDWDDIDVGNNQLNHSQNFFSKKHLEHERLDEMEILQQSIVKTKLNESIDPKEKCNDENKENSKDNFPLSPAVELKLEDLSSPAADNDGEEHTHQTEESVTSPVVVIDPLDGQKSQSKEIAKPGHLTTKVNLACQWSTQKTISAAGTSKGAISKPMPPPPQAYLVKDIYKRNREEAERRRLEEERKKREFHSRPAPKFSSKHEQLQKRKPVHAVTVAKTPQVLKTSRDANEKRRKKLEEWKLKSQPPKFEHRSPTVLKEKPFVPEKKPHVVQQCPFKLNMEKRLQERKQYEEAKQRSMLEKQKQVETEEEERKKREEERIKELRKAATFKARPNPFNKNVI